MGSFFDGIFWVAIGGFSTLAMPFRIAFGICGTQMHAKRSNIGYH